MSLEESFCIDGIQLFFVDIPENFINSKATCENLGGILAVPSDQNIFDRIVDTHQNLNSNVWVGIRDPNEIGGVQNFLSITDNVAPSFTNTARSSYPWLSNEPNSPGQENCVEVKDNFLNDIDCNELRPSLCQKACDLPTGTDICEENLQFLLFNERKTFNEAQASCALQGTDGTLAEPINLQKYTRMSNLYTAFADSGGAWIGLQDVAPLGGGTDRFVTLSNKVAPFLTSVNIGEFPWFLGEPNSPTNENCIEMGTLLNDVNCIVNRQYICQVSCVEEKIPPNSCINDDNLIALQDKLTFSQSRQVCQDLGGDLSRVTSTSEMNIITQFATDFGLASPWVGIESVNGAGNAQNFVFTGFDTITISLDFIKTTQGTFPWSSGQPDNSNGNNENCVHFTGIGADFTLNDLNCDILTDAICRIPNDCPLKEVCLRDEQTTSFTLSSDTKTFSQAKEFCQKSGGKLATPNSEELLVDLFGLLNPINSAWIGIERLGDDVIVVPSNYSFSDGSVEGLDFIQNKNVGDFPWSINEPDNSLNIEKCVRLDRTSINDVNCANQFNYICEYPNRCNDQIVQLEEQQNIPIGATAGACFREDLFVFKEELTDFDTARLNCQVDGGDLASIVNFEESNFVRQFLLENNVDKNLVWIGVKDQVGSLDTNDYVFVDGSSNRDFFLVGRGQFPWEPSSFEPNNINEKCVDLIDGSSLWNDRDCTIFSSFLCRYKNAQVCETIQPTLSPTLSPTDNPTIRPSRNPTQNPTKNPTQNPSMKPTTRPSKKPTTSPSKNPTESPTMNTSQNPTQFPTRSPVISPTQVDDCENNVQFVVFNEAKTFEQAQETCVLHGGSLAEPLNFDLFTRITNLFVTFRSGPSTWVGLQDSELIGGGTERYKTLIGGFAPEFTSGSIGQFPPWRGAEPNGPNIENCIELFPDGFNDIPCGQSKVFICQRQCQVPTLSPTKLPTQNPSRNPTIFPTLSPSLNPTVEPSKNPTKIPTSNPTTPFPTLNPTLNPTKNPTLNPTQSPTLNPSLNPTTSPTANPTQKPTLNPVKPPTNTPTKSPTLNPTQSPNLEPQEPSTSPTQKPTFLPSSSPLISPPQCSKRSFGILNPIQKV